MKVAGNVVVGSTAIVCLAALVVSIYPGVLNDLLLLGFLVSLVVVPVACLATLVAFVALASRGSLRSLRVPWTQVAVALGILVVTSVVLKLYLPRRIAFAASRGAFESMVLESPTSDGPGVPPNRRLGVYVVDEYAADPRGGVYFRVYRGADGLGPDTMSYGFVHRPNRHGTPFGAASYRVFALGDDWYWFRASNDRY